MSRKIIILAIFTIIFGVNSAFGSLTDADVFDWWDAGVITADEANEILSLLDEGNLNEACLLAAAYAQEPCTDIQTEEDKPKSGKRKSSPRQKGKKVEAKATPILKPSGHFMEKVRLDSTGRMESHREELLVAFYRYTLKLGTQNLLSYRDKGIEAHLGDISTKEIQSHIPLDTLWGTALHYPIGRLRLSAMLDSSLDEQVRTGLVLWQRTSFDVAYWHADGGIHSVAVHAKFPAGEISYWQQVHQELPLVKAELSGTDKSDWRTFRWNASAYFHGDSVPRFARLGNTILNNRFFGSESFSALFPDWANSKLSVSARFLDPLQGDSLSVRLRGAIQSGREFLRGSLSATCIEARESCEKTDAKFALSSAFIKNWTLSGSVKSRYTRGDGFGSKRYELGLTFLDTPRNFARVNFVLPDGNPSNSYLIQNDVHLFADFLDLSLTATFKATEKRHFGPSRGSVTAKILF